MLLCSEIERVNSSDETLSIDQDFKIIFTATKDSFPQGRKAGVTNACSLTRRKIKQLIPTTKQFTDLISKGKCDLNILFQNNQLNCFIIHLAFAEMILEHNLSLEKALTILVTVNMAIKGAHESYFPNTYEMHFSDGYFHEAMSF